MECQRFELLCCTSSLFSWTVFDGEKGLSASCLCETRAVCNTVLHKTYTRSYFINIHLRNIHLEYEYLSLLVVSYNNNIFCLPTVPIVDIVFIIICTCVLCVQS